MRGIDDTDREILQLLAENGRRPYSEIAESVGLSAPAVSDRVDRLEELGVVRQFTVDIDRSVLREGVSVLVSLVARPGAGAEIRAALSETERVEHTFLTVDDRVVCTATLPEGELGDDLSTVLAREEVREHEVSLLADSEHTPRVGAAEFAPTCVECGNTVTSEGETERLDDDTYHFCCESCRDAFVDQYERLQEGV